jgi:transposase-like protein
VHWPNQPVEQIPPRSFVPPHCPSPTCPTHAEPNRSFRFVRAGAFSRKCDRRVVPRFRCKICGDYFSQQTFAFSYYRKRPELDVPVAAGLLAGSAHRQLARSLKCAPSTVTRLAARLGRHSLLLLAFGLDQLDDIEEPVVYDDFETFFLSQDLPCGLSTPVGQTTSFIYGLDCAPHRRSGRPRPHRKRRRHADPQPESAGYQRAFQRTLDVLLATHHGPRPLDLVTDKHPGYRAGLRAHPQRRRIRHRVFANPKQRPSEEATHRDRAMFVVDLLHSLIRHSLAHHRRETIAFCRRLNALLERGFLMAVWRNWIKGRSERKNDRTTPAMQVGLANQPWDWSRVLAKRLFPWRHPVPAHWMTIYRRGLITPEIGPNTRHALIRAF